LSNAVFVRVAMESGAAPWGKGFESTGWQVAEIFVAVHWFAGAKEAGSGKVAGLAKVWEIVKGGFCPSSSDAENGSRK
jgi:hypothetical protein